MSKKKKNLFKKLLKVYKNELWEIKTENTNASCFCHRLIHHATQSNLRTQLFKSVLADHIY